MQQQIRYERYLNILLLFIFLAISRTNVAPISSNRKLSIPTPQTTTTKKISVESSLIGGEALTKSDDEDPDVLDDDEVDAESEQERCVAVDECVLCKNEEKLEDDCEVTLRHQKFECSSGVKRMIVYRSCNRTVQDEEALMVRFQLLCTLVAFISLMSTRRQKRVSASLFDQRRRSKRGTRSSNVGGDGDSVATEDSEMAPLTSNQSLVDSENV
mmetsp:Transcript_29054/g.35390  ORF Transcript_29054/g.35390 Transcript_29054/m.35390 type:complete len:214 (-) Transcript_29054:152-793(-)|eukprot:CAMPEP_0172495938 /NCGR_PEP_ID=MMETSP1066-20121228/79742_1 /TAXON_ID=671091 /ORGANISM="Coscinodiscus wailesii, Strain CCMP2513" /LENGTH=213 /DNA_ID=CAMNT_0013267961 /DNA_START=45 /DNA_END=686 /DNA_ORIENTATION=+